MKDQTRVKGVKCESVVVRTSPTVAKYYWCEVLSSCDNLKNDIPGAKIITLHATCELLLLIFGCIMRECETHI